MSRDQMPRRRMRRQSIAIVPALAFVVAALGWPGAASGGDGAASGQARAAGSAEEAAAQSFADDTAAAGGLGIYYDFERRQYVAVFSASQNGAGNGPRPASLRSRVEFRPIDRASIAAIEAALVARAFDPRAAEATYGSYFDPRSGRVVVDVVGDASIFDGLVQRFRGDLDVREWDTGGLVARNNDAIPHKGGAYLNAGGVQCTSGYSVRKSNGLSYMVTAGHCFNLGAAVAGGTGILWGGVSDRGPLPQRDAELLTGNHGGFIYSGGAAGVVQQVKAGDNPAIGPTSYCMSGRATNETCGHHAISLVGQFCTPGGCTLGLAVYKDGVMPQAGDSGAPFYNYRATGGVTIRGHLIGTSGPNMYSERWPVIKAHWSLTLITS